MPSRTTYTVGTPCWVDLFVPDPAAAQRFYGAVFGWTVGVAPAEGYRLMEHGGAVVAGIGRQDETGAPPAWSTYVRVDALEPTVARAVELGGSVAVEPFPIPGSGRSAVLQDPQGAAIHLWEPQGFAGAAVVNEDGAWAWNDLQTPDPATAAPFYAALFGWTIAEVPGGDGAYWSIAHEGRSIGGVMRSAATGMPPAWTVYLGTADLDAALARIADAGGRELVGPTAVPVGRFAVAADDQGAVICLVEAAFDD